jgi:protein-S-isoprenylcysteine O-methyltransferase Ste14
MRRIGAVLGSIVFFFIAPGTVAGFLPWSISRWVVGAPFFGLMPLRVVGVALIAFGLVPLIDSFRRFAVEGLGTPAPLAPTQTLVVTGFYRHVRNPMYVGVLATILGQALLFGNEGLLIYALVIALAFHIFVSAYEEPTLQRLFGADYEDYAKNVRRWLPRITPWKGAKSSA